MIKKLNNRIPILLISIIIAVGYLFTITSQQEQTISHHEQSLRYILKRDLLLNLELSEKKNGRDIKIKESVVGMNGDAALMAFIQPMVDASNTFLDFLVGVLIALLFS